MLACANCQIYPEKIKWCSACKKVAYCSRTCQKQDWRRHKKEDCNKTIEHGSEKQNVWDCSEDPTHQKIKDVKTKLNGLQETYKKNEYLEKFIQKLDKILNKNKPITIHQIEELKQWRQTYAHSNHEPLLCEDSYVSVIKALMQIKVEIMANSRIMAFRYGNPYDDCTKLHHFLQANAQHPNEAFVCSRDSESPPQSLLIMLTRNRKLYIGDEYMKQWHEGKIKLDFYKIGDFLSNDKAKAALEYAFFGIYPNHPTMVIDEENQPHIMQSFNL